MKQLYIIRGLPGSGKSTLAWQIANVVFEADMFFMKDGEYKYDKDKIGNAHRWCMDKVMEAMLNEASSIAVSNTFVKRWEMQMYYVMAKDFHYTVTEITLSGQLYDNVHGVPAEVIERMRTNWEV